ENWPVLGPTNCGMHFINASSNAFGNGIFDGYSIVTGHEYAEAVTDPDNIASWQGGWLDAQGSENGDKCAWASNSANITLASHSYAVQPLWSNEAYDATGNGCVLGRCRCCGRRGGPPLGPPRRSEVVPQLPRELLDLLERLRVLVAVLLEQANRLLQVELP